MGHTTTRAPFQVSIPTLEHKPSLRPTISDSLHVSILSSKKIRMDSSFYQSCQLCGETPLLSSLSNGFVSRRLPWSCQKALDRSKPSTLGNPKLTHTLRHATGSAIDAHVAHAEGAVVEVIAEVLGSSTTAAKGRRERIPANRLGEL